MKLKENKGVFTRIVYQQHCGNEASRNADLRFLVTFVVFKSTIFNLQFVISLVPLPEIEDALFNFLEVIFTDKGHIRSQLEHGANSLLERRGQSFLRRRFG